MLRHATLGNARTAGLDRQLGAIRPGYKADLILIDLNDVAYLPYNSAAIWFRRHRPSASQAAAGSGGSAGRGGVRTRARRSTSAIAMLIASIVKMP